MIKTKKQLNDALVIEKKMYFPCKKDFVCSLFLHDQNYIAYKYIKSLRYLEYYINTNKNKLVRFFAERKKNRLGLKYGIFICPNTVDVGLRIWHSGNIIVHADAKVGKNCQFHGMNCIGNKGVPGETPVIGDNCNIGIGAVVIGNLTLGNNITIGSNAVVTKSCETDGAVLVGVPAHSIK